MKKQAVNIIFFCRYEEPRIPELDLYETLAVQTRLIDAYDFPVTYLLEYDSLLDERYRSLLLAQKARMGDRCEIGGWFEIVRPLVERAGLTWRGREGYNWDWHSHVGFSVGYTQEERRRLVDVFMEDFKSFFGTYPKSVGSWVIDAYTLGYMADAYGVIASCNCRDQWGTDGYTLWGGYYAQGYYPSRWNMLCPANSVENQIPIPVFRMLGNDPIYQVDSKIEMDADCLPDTCLRDCHTLEPVYADPGGGGNREWVDWFLKETFTPQTLSFNYVHVGQENSFSWELQGEGTQYQFKRLQELQQAGILTLETLSQTGAWYRDTYPVTPAASITAFSDWHGLGHQSFWYNSRFYRMNMLVQDGAVLLRDLQLFRDTYTERYYDTPCPSEAMTYDNLPVVDGNRWSNRRYRAGLHVGYLDGEQLCELTVSFVQVAYPDDHTMELSLTVPQGVVSLRCTEDQQVWQCPDGMHLCLWLIADKAKMPDYRVEPQQLVCSQRDFVYTVQVENGVLKEGKEQMPWLLVSDRNTITLQCFQR